MIRFQVQTVRCQSSQLAGCVEHNWFHNDFITIEVGISSRTSTVRTRTVIFRDSAVIIASVRDVATEDFFAVTNTVAIRINAVATTNSTCINFRTWKVERVVVVASGSIAAVIRFIANTVAIYIAEAIAIATIVERWEFTFRLVVVECISIKVTSRSIQASHTRCEFT